MDTPKLPLIMGILNITPDSFSDGGKFMSVDAALKQTERMVKDGADIIDIGGESTRPGSLPVSLQEEKDRVLPVLEKIAKNLSVRISIDTQKFEMASEAIPLGATIINDVSGGRDIRMLSLLKDRAITYILMHMQNTPETMQENPVYPNGVVQEVKNFLRDRVRKFKESGVQPSQLWVDPGIGFGKTTQHNLDLLRHLEMFKEVGHRLVIGTSRKGFLTKVSGKDVLSENEKLSGTVTTNLWASQNGASVFRVHDVAEMKLALTLLDGIRHGSF